jgi:hypothetical protein
MTSKQTPRKRPSKASGCILVLDFVEQLVATGLAFHVADETRISLLTGEVYALTGEGVVRMN